jgi:hypothetical protein
MAVSDSAAAEAGKADEEQPDASAPASIPASHHAHYAAARSEDRLDRFQGRGIPR